MSLADILKAEHARDVNDNHVQRDSGDSNEDSDDCSRSVQLVVPAPKRFRSNSEQMADVRCSAPAKENVHSNHLASRSGMPSLPQLPWQLPLYRSYPQYPFLPYPGYPAYPFPVPVPEHLRHHPYSTEYLKYFPNTLMYSALPFQTMSSFCGTSKETQSECKDEKLTENDSIISRMAKDEMKDNRENSSQLIRLPTVFLDKDSVNDIKKRDGQTDHVKYQCDTCNKSYSTFSGLSKHKQFHCARDQKKEFTCKYCEKTYVSLGALKMHIRTHTLPCKCKICGKSFSRPWLLQGHVRTHTGEKPFTCVHCLRAFADRSNLRAHLQTHSDVKKYSCRSCNKTFSRMSLLLKHEDTCKNVTL